MFRGAASFALGGLLALGQAPAFASDLNHYRSDGWSLAVRHDRFIGQIRCRLASSNHRLRYQPGAVGFFAGKHRDTLTSWYQVDDGAPVRWQDRTAALIAASVEIDGPALDNPTGGWLWIPISEVAQARTVAVRIGDHGHVHRYALAGFTPMLDAARRLGCATDDAFRI